MPEPEVWSLERLLAHDLGCSRVWTHESLTNQVSSRFSQPLLVKGTEPPSGLDSLVVVGGGELLDIAKIWRAEKSPGTRLYAIPSLWASGAECSPIAVLNQEQGKVIRKGAQYLPDVRVVWRELAESVPPVLARHACGDVWAHALEGFLSPLGDQESRIESAALLRRLLATPPRPDPEWFELGARACAVQARTSAGLVHGIAHVLEPALRRAHLLRGAGHAHLCGTCLWPVFQFNRSRGDRVELYLEEHELDPDALGAVLRVFFDSDFYSLILPFLQENWRHVLRDPCTRTNCVLVRPDHIGFFVERHFL